MKLTTAQVQTVIDQVDAEPVPEHHPTYSELEDVFGQHTFFVGVDGLHVVEPSGETDSGKQQGYFIKLASWNDEEKTTLSTHNPELAGTVELDSGEDPDPAA